MSFVLTGIGSGYLAVYIPIRQKSTINDIERAVLNEWLIVTPIVCTGHRSCGNGSRKWKK